MKKEHIINWILTPIVIIGTIEASLLLLNKKENERMERIKPIITAINKFYYVKHQLPRNLEILNLSPIPVDQWNQPYQYEFAEHNTYRIISAGPDRQINTPDDITLKLSAD